MQKYDQNQTISAWTSRHDIGTASQLVKPQFEHKKYRFTFCIHWEIWSRHQKITFQDMIVAFLWDNTRRWAIEREIMTRCPRGTDGTWTNNTSMTRDEINWKRLAKQDNARFVNHLKTGAGQKMKVLEAKLDGKLCVNWCYFLAYIYFDLYR